MVVQRVGINQSSEIKQSKSGVISKQGVVSWSLSEAPGVSIKARLEQKPGQEQRIEEPGARA